MANVDNVFGIEICANDNGLGDLMTDIIDLKSEINSISEELYRIVSEINSMTDWKGNGKEATERVLKVLVSYASLIAGKSDSFMVDNFVKTSGLTINGSATSDHFEQLTNAISVFSSEIYGFEGTSTPVKELKAM